MAPAQKPMPARTLADHVVNTGSVFHGSAAVAQPMEEDPISPSEELAAEIARIEQEVLSVPPDTMTAQPPAAPAMPTMAQRAEPAMPHRGEPSMTVKREPLQGSLHMDLPPARLPDLKIDRPAAQAPAAPAVPAQHMADETPAEEPKRAGLFTRWTAPRPTAAQPAQRTEPQVPMAPRPAAAAAPARPQAEMPAARVSPTDRLTTSKAEEDMLDIPAFLRRQAN